MQGAVAAVPESYDQSVRLEGLLKRVVSGELALPCNAHDLSLSSKVDFGTIHPDTGSLEIHQRPIHLFNSGLLPIIVARIDLAPAAEFFCLHSDASLRHPMTLPAVIAAGSALSFVISLRATSYPGKLSCRLVVTASTQPDEVALEQITRTFIIGCMCTAVIRNPLVEAAADVDAKAFVPAAILSIFDHSTPSYSTEPPECGNCSKLVCCLCHNNILQLCNREPKVKSANETGYSHDVPEQSDEAEPLLQPSDLMSHLPPHQSHLQQSSLFGQPECVTRYCQCRFHLSCIQRWGSVMREGFPFLLPCPACGMAMAQLHIVLSALPQLSGVKTNISSSASILMERIARASDVHRHSALKADIVRREHFIRHLMNLIEAAKAEFFARLDEMRGFASFDVEFREIETKFPDALAAIHPRNVQLSDAGTGPSLRQASQASLHAATNSLELPPILLLLKLPGVPENSPKLQLYQNLRLRFSRRGLPESPETISGAEFVCHVVKVRGSEVVVACHSAIAGVLRHHRTDPLNLHVCFCMDMLAISQDFRLLLFGLDMHYICPLLLPCVAEARPSTPAPATAIFDSRLSDAQLQCVACALQSVARDDGDASPAHIICGPPGTGKTSVLAEIILQLWQMHQQEGSGCILVTAPSPDAADVLALRLREHLSPEELLLVCSTRRNVDTLRPGLLEYTNIVTTESYGIPIDVFVLPSILQIQSRSVIVASCSACLELSDVLADAGKHGGFHARLVVVDEAAQATEIDALKALAFVGGRTRVLLAGDHMQLGPVIISKHAFNLQFQVSLMQRLVGLEVYRLPGMCSPLSVNYRSHPALIAVPSFLFYHDSIRCAQPTPSDATSTRLLLSNWAGLPRRDFPLMFYGVAGIDSSPDGHGVRNSVEAKSLLFLVSKLLEDMPWLSQSDVGVMAPFRLQVRFVRSMFRNANLRDVKVGTVDDYQGQEGKVIFVSTTVSRRYGFSDFNGHAAAVSFIGNPQRFNVALSRAQHMLVIVGDPWVLNMDRCWGTLLRFCIGNHVYKGCPLPPSLMPSARPSH